jgi:hypothetical protein
VPPSSYRTVNVAKAVLVSSVAPLMLKTDKNPGGLPISVFDDLRARLAANRAQFYKDITSRSTATTGQAQRFPKAFGNIGGCRA